MANTALITGANQGLGLGLVKRLAETYTSADTIYMGVRRVDAGEEAVRALGNYECVIEPIYLDVTNEETVKEAAGKIEERHGKIDLVISNAAARISNVVANEDQVEPFVTTNNFGTYLMLKSFTPLLKGNGFFIVVASAFGSLLHLPNHLHEYFATETMTMEEVNDVMTAYVDDVKHKKDSEKGWPQWINIASKIGQVALARIAARQAADENLQIFSVCPGLVDTDASRPFFDNMDEALSPYEAAAPIIELTKSFDPARNGELIQYGKILPWK